MFGYKEHVNNIAKLSPSPREAGLSKLYNHGGTATAKPPPPPPNRQSIRKQTFRLCLSHFKADNDGVKSKVSLLS